MKKFFNSNNGNHELRHWASLLAVSAYGVKNSPYHQPFEPDETPHFKHPIDCNVVSVALEGVDYISINGALHLLYCASRSSNFAEVELRRMLRSSPLKCVQTKDAPAHPLNWMQGKIADVSGGSSFWMYAWWLVNAMSQPKTSKDWQHWLLGGGVVVEREAIEEACLDAIRSTHQDEMRIVQSRFPNFLPITEALATAVSHEFGINFDIQEECVRWEDLICISPSHSALGEMEDGFKILIDNIERKALQLWAVRHSDPSPVPIVANDVYGAKLIVGSNSGGLMGFSDVKSAALFSPKELNELFPNSSYKAKYTTAMNSSKSSAGRPQGKMYDDEPIINDVLKILKGPKKMSRARAIRIALAQHGGGQGASEHAISQRISAAIKDRI